MARVASRELINKRGLNKIIHSLVEESLGQKHAAQDSPNPIQFAYRIWKALKRVARPILKIGKISLSETHPSKLKSNLGKSLIHRNSLGAWSTNGLAFKKSCVSTLSNIMNALPPSPLSKRTFVEPF